MRDIAVTAEINDTSAVGVIGYGTSLTDTLAPHVGTAETPSEVSCPC